MKIAITGSTGQLGQLVIEQLLKSVPANQLIAIARNPAKACKLAARGINVRQANYDDPVALHNALEGVERLLLIASNELGRRITQHANVINSAKKQGIRLLAYTSLLHADTSPLSLAVEYARTESDLKASGIPFVILRNGWYTENHMAGVPAAAATGMLYGCAGNGRIASAPRIDLAEAAAKVLASGGPAGQTLELAGDTAHTLAELAAEIARQCGRDVVYKNLPEPEYREILMAAGFPEPIASGFANWDTEASRGALFDDGHQLSKWIGRPTTPLSEIVRQTLAQAR
ncbi:MAG: SDR family oxidoreductase [Puniceicoccales bacterium]|jgi:NAD(P)H dehydrogenase (quinone)|nr:SDR family oxidoreductase [Puniceicoccales bacterium]